MSHPRQDNWIRILKILSFSSRQVAEEIRAPATPFVVPLLFVSIASAVILWIFIPLILNAFGIGLKTIDNVPHPDSELESAKLAHNLIFELPVYALGLIFLGTYYFGIARYFQIDDIWWEHWFGFACWTHVPLILIAGASCFIDVYAVTVNPSLGVSVFVVGLCFLLPIAWTVHLYFQGLRIWTKRGWAVCLCVSVLPYSIVILSYVRTVIELFMRAVA